MCDNLDDIVIEDDFTSRRKITRLLFINDFNESYKVLTDISLCIF